MLLTSCPLVVKKFVFVTNTTIPRVAGKALKIAYFFLFVA